MIVFGIRSGKLKTLNSQLYDCEYCKVEKTVFFCFYQEYVHVFWIPILPIGKTGSSFCRHCHHVLYPNQMSILQKQGFTEEKALIKTPFGYKIVLFLLMTLISLVALLGLYHVVFM